MQVACSRRLLASCAALFLTTVLPALTPYADAADPDLTGPDTIAAYGFDEGGGNVANDATGHGHDGNLHGPRYVTDSADGSAYALRFDGSNDYVDLGNLDVSGNQLTLAAWFKADSYPGKYRDPRLISKASSQDANEHVFMLGTIHSGGDTRLRGRIRINGRTTTLIASEGSLPTGQWKHAALTYDGSNMRLYLDGAVVGSQSLSGAVDVDPSLAATVGSNGPGKWFDGLIDNVHIVDRALSASELAQLAAASPTAPSDPVDPEDAPQDPATFDSSALAVYRFDEGSGSVATDASTAGNDGRVYGATYVADSADGSAYALRFKGANDHVDLGNLDVASNQLTLAAWFKADSYPDRDPRIISKASGDQANQHVFMLSTTRSGTETRLRARLRVNGQTKTLIARSGNLPTGVWIHGAVTYDGARLRLFVDGEAIGSTALSGTIDTAPALGVAVGSQPGGSGRTFDGLIDDVQILGRALGASELAALVSGTGSPDDGGDGPVITLSASKSSITPGTSTTLSWSASNAESCGASGGWSGNKATSGDQTMTPSSTTTYTLSCSGDGGNGSASVTVTVTGPSTLLPEMSFNADDVAVAAGSSTTLRWSSSNTSSCTATSGWSGTKGTSGSENVGPINSTTTFSLSCTGVGGSVMEMLSVGAETQTVLGWSAPTKNVDGSPLTDLRGFRFYIGERSGDYNNTLTVNSGYTTSEPVTLTSGEYFIAMTAVNSRGEESRLSNEVRLTIP